MSFVIGWILRGGVLLSIAFIILGIFLLLIQPQQVSSHALLLFPKTFSELAQGISLLHPQAIITLGLFILIATPVVRVGVSIIAFSLEKDWKFVIITFIVYFILLISIFYCGAILGHKGVLFGEQFSFVDMIFIFFASIIAGFLGSLVGLGGGFLIIPMLTLIFHFPMYFAIGAGLITVIATSSGAASSYLKEHITNLRVGMFLEIATTTGAICGAFLAGILAQNILSLIFGVILFISAAPLIFELGEELPHGVTNDGLAKYFRLNSFYFDAKLKSKVIYNVTRTWLGLLMMYVAGLISGLLGVGSGTFKVVALDTAMRLPIKVSTTTSNFMIGVTAAASVGIYFSRGDILPLVTAPIAVGTILGAMIGARILPEMSNKVIRFLFLILIFCIAGGMILQGVNKL